MIGVVNVVVDVSSMRPWRSNLDKCCMLPCLILTTYQTIVIQRFARMAMWRLKWLRFKVIPPVIQRYVRGYLAR